MSTTRIHRQSLPVHHDVVDTDELYSTRMPSSTRRYKAPDTSDDSTIQDGSFVQRRASRNARGAASKALSPAQEARGIELASTRRRTMVMLIVGAVGAVVLIMLISALLSWWHGVMDNIQYGYPRTSQMDAVVGHNDSEANPTHFIFINLHGHVEIIEIPGGDASRARIFTGPTLVGSGQDLIPVTGEIRHEDGRLDLIVHIQDQQIVYINDGSTFHEQ